MIATRTGLIALALACMGSPAATAAGPAPGPEPARTSRSRVQAVTLSCRSEVARLCPELNQPPGLSGRNVAICLKPYRTSLSAACRKSVTAIFP